MAIKIPSHDPIKYLVYKKYPKLAVLAQEDNGMVDALSKISLIDGDPTLTSHEWPKLTEDAEAYRQELSILDKADLEEIYNQELEKQRVEDDQNQFFNRPNAEADFDYWSKMPEWTVDEAVVLSFGKNPEVVTWPRLEAILSYTSPFVDQCRKLKELVARAKKANLLTDKSFSLSSDPVKPQKFVRWMQANHLTFPQRLAEQVLQTYEANKPPKSAFDISLEKLENISTNGNVSLIERAKKSSNANEAKKENASLLKPLSNKEKSAYLNIIGALLGTLLGKSSNGKPYSQFRSQQAVIDSIQANFGEQHGLSVRNRENKFAEAKRNLNEPSED